MATSLELERARVHAVVSRYCVQIVNRGRSQVDLSGSLAAATDRWGMWRLTEDKIREVAQTAHALDDLPGWLLDLGDQLGVEQPVAGHEDVEHLPVIEADREPWNANWLRRPPE